MNEKTFQSFLGSRLRREFKNIVLQSIREGFFKKFTEITNQYENGELIIDGNHSLNALIKAFDDINYKDVNDAIITDVKTKIITDCDIDGKVVLDFNFCSKINGISGFVSNVCRHVIKNRDLFGVTDRTFVKNRDRVDREEIVGSLNWRLRDKCDKIQLDDGFEKDIDKQIEENVECMIQNIFPEENVECMTQNIFPLTKVVDWLTITKMHDRGEIDNTTFKELKRAHQDGIAGRVTNC